jgi:adenosylhomocysteine nucleosidase
MRYAAQSNGSGRISMPTTKIAIVAAMEREVWPLVNDWPTVNKDYDGRSFKFFEKPPVVLICGGIGSESARRAAEAVINLYGPALIVSAGFAGGLDPKLQAGQMLTPRHVLDASDGSRTDSGTGEGVLVSFESVADVEQKAKLAGAYGAHAVDMEAAAVARSAEAHGIKFLACKVISDTHDSRLPPIMRFVKNGQFNTGSFIAHIAIRPWLWPGVVKLARNSAVASKVLSEALGSSKFHATHTEMLVGSKT